MKKQIKTLIYVIMAISLVACTFIGFNRVQTERNNKGVEIAVRYSDVLRLAIEGEVPLKEVLTQFKKIGVTTLLVKENTVASAKDNDYYTYKGLGKVSLIDGYILKFYYPDLPDIKPETRYIVTQDPLVAANIAENYAAKGMDLEGIETENEYFLEIGDHSPSLTVTGVGFDEESLNMAADLGFSISLQLKNWEEPDQQSLQYVMEEIEGIKGVNTIYFSDAKVPGATSEAFARFIEENYKLGFIEFSSNKQEGFSALAKATSKNGTDYRVVRLHTLEDGKVDTFTIPALMARYELALKERNNRVFLFKLPNTGKLGEDYTYLEEAITTFEKEVTKDGYTIVPDVAAYNFQPLPVWLTILAALGAIMVFILLMAEAGFVRAGYILALIGFAGYLGILKLRTNQACQLMALFGSIVFPTYAIIKGIREERRNVKEALLALLKIAAISFGGVLTTVGMLARTNFALGIDVFMGVKLATTAPILLVLLYLVYEKHGMDLKFYLGLLQRKISYGELLVVGVLGAVLAIYVSRSGNAGTTSDLELAFRQLLDNLLGVRPRTKEILIGYPILLAFLYYGYNERYIIFMIFAIMGPLSLVNTYAHIHTPILISLIRSGYGILIGAIVGLILIWLIKLVSKVIKKWQIQLR